MHLLETAHNIQIMEYSNYFQFYKNYFWQWEEEGEVIAIPDSYTITYRNYIIELIEKISDQGLPPFGTLLLAVIATNPKGNLGINAIETIFDDLVLASDKNQLSKAIRFLTTLSNLPEAYKSGEKRILVFQSIFQNCHNINSVKKSKKSIKIMP